MFYKELEGGYQMFEATICHGDFVHGSLISYLQSLHYLIFEFGQ